MSKILFLCLRNPSKTPDKVRSVAAVCDRLLPDNVASGPSRVSGSGGIIIGISDTNQLVSIQGNCVAVGHLVASPDWHRPSTSRPDGAFAIFRSDDAVVEIVSDTLATRTVWYVLTDEFFAASTSQRALVMLLGSFEFNSRVTPWMLTTGTLGPGYSWDRRLHCAPGATRVVLDRMAWTLQEHTEPIRFEPRQASPAEHRQRMVEAIRRSVRAIDTSDPALAITLSGGADCRTILSLLPGTVGLRAVTWGLRASLTQRSNDAYVAHVLAKHFGLQHQYFETDLAGEAVEHVLNRFVANGEVRIDHLSGYVDGFSLWSRLVAAGVHAIIRGDVAFGRPPVRTSSDVRATAEMMLWSDFRALPPLEGFGLPTQETPTVFERRENESLETWRDRLQQQYRVPYLLAALSDLKLPYVEIINPLVAGSVIDVVRELPDELRTSKALLKQIASLLSPDIPFATEVAIQAGDNVLQDPQVVRVIRDYLSDNSDTVIPAGLIAYVLDDLVHAPPQSRFAVGRKVRATIRAHIPSWVRRMRQVASAPSTPNRNRLAFRAYLVMRAYRLYVDDARALRSDSLETAYEIGG